MGQKITFLWLGLFCLGVIACQKEDVATVTFKEKPVKVLSQGIITCTSKAYIEAGADEPYEKFSMVGMFPKYEHDKGALVDNLLGDKVPQIDLPIDTCSQPAPIFNTYHRREPGPTGTAIKLLDVGDISVQYGDLKSALPTRTFPDLLKVIDGVIYSAEESRNITFHPGETYTVYAKGTDQIASFEAVLQAPEELGEIKVNGIYPGDKVPFLRRNEPSEITWEGEGYGDEVIISVNWSGTNLSWTMTCRVRDDGHFVIPPDATKELSDLMIGSEHEMNMARLRQVSFVADGLTSGEFSFLVSAGFLIRFEAKP